MILTDIDFNNMPGYIDRFADGVIVNLDSKAIIIKNNMDIQTINLSKSYQNLGVL